MFVGHIHPHKELTRIYALDCSFTRLADSRQLSHAATRIPSFCHLGLPLFYVYTHSSKSVPSPLSSVLFSPLISLHLKRYDSIFSPSQLLLSCLPPPPPPPGSWLWSGPLVIHLFFVRSYPSRPHFMPRNNSFWHIWNSSVYSSLMSVATGSGLVRDI